MRERDVLRKRKGCTEALLSEELSRTQRLHIVCEEWGCNVDLDEGGLHKYSC